MRALYEFVHNFNFPLVFRALLRRGIVTCSSVAFLYLATRFFRKRLASSYKGKMDETSDLLSQLHDTPQKIRFSGTDNDNSCRVHSKDVTVVTNSGHHESGSSQVKLKNVVDFTWDLRYYTGHLLAVHSSGKYLGYAIKSVSGISNNPSGAVRVVNIETNERALLKGQDGMIVDVAFACIPSEVVLGSIDEYGNVFVNDIKESSTKVLVCTLLMHVKYQAEPVAGMVHRIIWCPYIPEDDSEESQPEYSNTAKLLALIHGPRAELWNVPMVTQKYGIGPLESQNIEEGYFCIEDHSSAIIDASFSPDGSAVATASLDGYVKFFQVYMNNEEKPKCLHQWKPHNGKPLSSLFFLDDHKNIQPDVQFWKFAITGADRNSEIKLWSCETWTCLQTLHFEAEIGKKDMILKAGLDLEANYLLLSDLTKRVLFVLDIRKDDYNAVIRSVSEFLLANPLLSFGIVDAGEKKFKNSSLNFEDIYGDDEVVDDSKCIKAVIVRMFLVHPKSLQECHVVFDPVWPEDDAESSQPLNKEAFDVFEKKILDVKVPPSAEKEVYIDPDDLPVNQMFDPLQSASVKHEPQLELMAPDVFSSPKQIDVATDKSVKSIETYGNASAILNGHNDLISMSPAVTPKMTKSPLLDRATGLDERHLNDSLEEKSPKNEVRQENNTVMNFQGIASGNSSPSREVQEILDSYSSNQSSVEEPAINLQISAGVLQHEGRVQQNNNEVRNPVESMVNGWPQAPALARAAVFSPNVSNEQLLAENINLDSPPNNRIYAPGMPPNGLNTQIISAFESYLDARLTANNELIFRRISDSQLTLMREFNAKFDNQNSLIKQLMEMNQENDTQRVEVLMAAISQTINNVIGSKLEEIVSEELNNIVPPKISNILEPVKEEFRNEVSQKLSSTIQSIRESVSRLVNSKAFMDTLSTSVGAGLQPYLQSMFKTSVTSFMLPRIEKVMQKVLGQMEEVFIRGTKEYVHSLEGYLEKCSRQNEKEHDSYIQLQFVLDSMRTNNELLSSTLRKQMEITFRETFDVFGTKFSDDINDMKEKIDSRAVTPSPHVLDYQVNQAQIMQLIAQGHINSAFQQALSASDLDLVMFVCEKVNPQQVFNQNPCPLQQEVLLSLIQQLSVDISNHTEIKHKYLEEAIMNLSPQNPMYCAHTKNILNKMIVQLDEHIATHPNDKISKSLKKLNMIAHSIITTLVEK